MRFSLPQSLRRLLVVTVFLLSGETRLFAQTPAWQWATSPGYGEGRSTATDAAGNVYVTGSFRGTATFGTITLTSAGGTDIFVAKLTSSGTYQWAVRAGGSGSFESGAGVAVDGTGHVVVTGNFDSPSATFGASTLTSAGSMEAFVARLTPTGAWQWAVRAGGSGEDFGSDVALTSSGQIVVAGAFSGTATVGDSTFTTAAAGGFVARLTPAGAWQWANHVVSSGIFSYGHRVAVAPSGHVVITGSFLGTATLGNTTLVNPVSGHVDFFVAQLTPAGAWQWVNHVGGSLHEYGHGVAVSGSGHIVITGIFYNTVAFGTTSLTSAGDEDAFVAQLTPTGAWQWAVRAGAAGYDEGYSVAVESSGHVVVVGRFSQTVAFGATTLSSSGSTDVYVARLTPAGVWQWVTRAGGNGQERGHGVAVDGSGDVVVTGSFQNIVNFGATRLTSQNSSLSSSFVARLSPTTSLSDASDQPLLTLAPNPARTTVQVTEATGPTATLLDGLGRVVSTVPITPSGAATLDVRALPAGLYLMRAGRATRRLVVE